MNEKREDISPGSDHQSCDKPRSNCGVVGVYGCPQAAVITYYALHALQHRGQEAAGIVSTEITLGERKPRRQRVYKGAGLVTDVFADFNILTNFLSGNAAIGHNRYSTTGSNNIVNVQPLNVSFKSGQLSISHNGNLTNTRSLWRQLEEEGTIFQTSTDTEIFLHLIARSRKNDPIDQILDSLNTVRGAFSLTMLFGDKLIAARDPHGIRPLALGQLEGGGWIVASETCAFDINRAEYVRDIEPGEVLVFDQSCLDGNEPTQYWIGRKVDEYHHCIFEYIYFSRPDSMVFGDSVDRIRRKLGKVLADESPVRPVDGEPVVVISVPDSSNTATLGFVRNNKKQGIDTRFEIGLIRNHYVGRTFIQPEQDKRELKTRLKFNMVRGVLRGRTVVVVDDSIVRGTTSLQLLRMLRESKPKALHVRISSPPITHPCMYGMDFPSKEELVANKFQGDVEGICNYLQADSLAYLSQEGMLSVVDNSGKKGYCTACFDGHYPVPIEKDVKKDDRET